MKNTSIYPLSDKEKKNMYQNALVQYEQEVFHFIQKNNISFQSEQEKKESIQFFKKLVFLYHFFAAPKSIFQKSISFYHSKESRESYLKKSILFCHQYKEKENITVTNGVKGRKQNKPTYPLDLKHKDLYLHIEKTTPLQEKIDLFIAKINAKLPHEKQIRCIKTFDENQTKFHIHTLNSSQQQTIGRFLEQKKEALSTLASYLESSDSATLFFADFMHILKQPQLSYTIATPEQIKTINPFNQIKKEYHLPKTIKMDETLFFLLKELLKEATLKSAIEILQEYQSDFQTLAQQIQYLQTKEQKNSTIYQDEAIDTIVLSANPRTLARMSSYVRWENESCMNPKAGNHSYVAQDIAHGTILVYGINSQNPYKKICRLLLKPYKGEKGDIVYHVGKTYGLFSSDFSTAVTEFVNQHINKPKSLIFKTNTALYQDNQPQIITFSTNLDEIYKIYQLSYSTYTSNNKTHYIVKDEALFENTFQDIDYSTTTFQKKVVFTGLKPPKKIPFYAEEMTFVNALVNDVFDFNRIHHLEMISCIIKNYSASSQPQKLSITGGIITETSKELNIHSFETDFTNLYFKKIKKITASGKTLNFREVTFDNLESLDAQNVKNLSISHDPDKKPLKLKSLQFPCEEMVLRNTELMDQNDQNMKHLSFASLGTVLLNCQKLASSKKYFYLTHSKAPYLKELDLSETTREVLLSEINLSHVQNIKLPTHELKRFRLSCTQLPHMELNLKNVIHFTCFYSDLSKIDNLTPSSMTFDLTRTQLSDKLTKIDLSKTYISEFKSMDLKSIEYIKAGHSFYINNCTCKHDCIFDFSKSASAKILETNLQLHTDRLPKKELILQKSCVTSKADVLDLSSLTRVTIENSHLKGVKKIIAPKILEINDSILDEIEEIDFSKCSTIKFKKMDLSKLNLVLEKIKKVTLLACTLSETIQFKNCTSVNLSHSKFVQENPTEPIYCLDLSQTNEAELNSCNLKNIIEITPPKKSISMVATRFSGMLTQLDLSTCKEANLEAARLEDICVFKAPTDTLILDSASLPKKLDLSSTKNVSMKKCNLSEISLFIPPYKALDLSEAELPKQDIIDLSGCARLNLAFAKIPAKQLILRPGSLPKQHKALCSNNIFTYRPTNIIESLICLLTNSRQKS